MNLFPHKVEPQPVGPIFGSPAVPFRGRFWRLAAVSSIRRLGLGPGWSFLLERLTFALGSDVLRRHILTLGVTFWQVLISLFRRINELASGTSDA